MKNVYDILVNFKKIPYEFYEWNKEDDVKHIKKIPSFKVNDDVLKDIINNDVVVSNSFLELIKDKTEVFIGRMIKVIKYACIIFNDEFSLALCFDNNGLILGRSKLLFDEDDDVVKSGKELKESNIEYNVINKLNCNLKCTRYEIKMIHALSNYLDLIYEKAKKEELMYLYFECFNKPEENISVIYKDLKQSITSINFNVINKLKTLIKVLKK